jgi:hypothetical protein
MRPPSIWGTRASHVRKNGDLRRLALLPLSGLPLSSLLGGLLGLLCFLFGSHGAHLLCAV